MAQRKKGSRICTGCGSRYHRRNLIEGWDKRNPGHRAGWHKKTLKICMNCQPATMTDKVINIAQIVAIATNTATIKARSA